MAGSDVFAEEKKDLQLSETEPQFLGFPVYRLVITRIWTTWLSTLVVVWGGEGSIYRYEGWNFNCGNYLFTTDTK